MQNILEQLPRLTTQPSDLQICNEALHLVAAKQIGSLDDETDEAKCISVIYPGLKEMMLNGYPWKFDIAGDDRPVDFTIALMLRLSAEICIPITNNSSKARFLFDQAEYALRSARGKHQGSVS